MNLRRSVVPMSILTLLTASIVSLVSVAPSAQAGTGPKSNVSHQLNYGPSPASPSAQAGSAPLPSDAPNAVRSLYGSIIQKGGIVKGITSAAYQPNAGSTSSGSASPLSYPTGCGLWVVLYKSGRYMVNSSLTSCTTPVAEIQMYGGVAREHWYGWEELENGEDGNEGASSLSLDVNAYCYNSGSFIYAAATNGYLLRGSTEYTASAYDDVSSTAC